MAFLPARALNVGENEIARAFKCVGNMVEPISFVVPRKSDAFQADLFPPALSGTAALSAEQWLSGQSAQPKLIDLESRQESSSPVKTFLSSTPAPAVATPVRSSTAPTPTSTAPSSQSAGATPRVFDRSPAATRPVSVVTSSLPPLASPSPSTPAVINGSSSRSSDEEISRLRSENEELRLELAKRDNLLRSLELKLEKVRAAMSI